MNWPIYKNAYKMCHIVVLPTVVFWLVTLGLLNACILQTFQHRKMQAHQQALLSPALPRNEENRHAERR